MNFDWRYLFRLALGVLFAWAALAKIGDLSGFATDVRNFHLLPNAVLNLFAMTIPWIELTAALLLVLNVAPRAGVIVLGGLLVVFLIAITSAIVRHLDIACGCFGTHDAARTGFTTLLRDVGMLVLAIIGWPPRKASSSAPWGSRAAETA